MGINFLVWNLRQITKYKRINEILKSINLKSVANLIPFVIHPVEILIYIVEIRCLSAVNIVPGIQIFRRKELSV